MQRPKEGGKDEFNGQRLLGEQEPGMFEGPHDNPHAWSMMCVREV